MSQIDMDDLYIALHQTAKKSIGGISAIARALGKRETALAGKLNPIDETHLPNLGEFVAVMHHTRDTFPLEVLCEMFGGQFSTRAQGRHDSPLVAAVMAISEGADVTRAVEEALRDGVISEHERVGIKREIQEARAALQILENSL